MKKKLLFIFFISVIIISVGIIYLNRVYLPTKIKSLIIQTLQDQTQKKVTLESLQFSILKGLVFRNLAIYEGKQKIIDLKEGSCRFLILPFLRKEIIITSVRLKSPSIFLERRPDNTFNLADLLLPQKLAAQKKRFRLSVYKVTLANARVDFQDDTLDPNFIKTIDSLNLTVAFSLPLKIKFNLQCRIPAHSDIRINGAGEFNIVSQQMLAEITIQNLSPQEFHPYYENKGFVIPRGLINASIKLNFKNNLLSAELDAETTGLLISKDKIAGNLNSDIKVGLQYSLNDNQLKYSGEADIVECGISGLEFADTVKDIKGTVKFDNSGLSSDKLNLFILGRPVELKLILTNFNNPLLNIETISNLDLNYIKGILKDKFQFVIPADIQGEAKLSLTIQNKAPSADMSPQINGYFDIFGAKLAMQNLASPVENISGRIEFSQNQLRWPGLNFEYSGLAYKTAGILTNFKAPGVQLEVSSANLYLESIFAVNDKEIKLSKCAGRYIDSEFSLTGNIDLTDSKRPETQINARLNIDLDDLEVPLKKFKEQLDKINPRGIMYAQLSLAGNLKDIKSCVIKARLSGTEVSAYGLKSQEFFLDYNQADGLIDIPLMHLSLYDGILDASAKMNLSSPNLPYRLILNIERVKLEKLKLDTGVKEKDISGTIQAEAKINGFSNDLSKISGTGKIFITDGKLWQLNLFKGLGVLLFTTDFNNIIFSEGYCGFTIQDKTIFSDSLKLKSKLADLTGSVKIGFDGSIDASLDVRVLDQLPLTGTFKDITTTIIGQAGRFGVIKISGTLKEPKYKFKTAIVDIIKSLKDIFLKE